MKRLLALLVGLLVMGTVANVVSAERTKERPIEPNEGDILPGPFEEWKVEYSYVDHINYGPWTERITHHCYSESCTVYKEITHCSVTSLWGTIKTSISEIESELGFSIGIQDCESVGCSATCSYGQAVTLYWRYKQPVYGVVQRKYIIDQFGREHATDETVVAYARQEWTPECKSIAS